MPIKKNNFSSHEIGEKKPKTRRAVQKTPVFRTVNTAKKTAQAKKEKMNKELTAIYSDKTGCIPDMKKINKKKHNPILKGVFIFLSISTVMAATAWAGFFYLPNQNNNESLFLDITGPLETTLNATTTYTISYKNTQNIELLNPVLSVKYPDSFVYLSSTKEPNNTGATEWNLKNLKPGEKGEIKITGQNFGTIEKEESWRIFINYKPENFNSEMQKMDTLTTKITKSPISLSVAGPDKSFTGEDVKYTFTMLKKEDWQPDNLQLQTLLPNNFFITSSSPKIKKDGSWIIQKNSENSTTTKTEYVFTVIGQFTDTNTDQALQASIKAELEMIFGEKNTHYKIGYSDIDTEITKNKQSFNLAINGTMKDFNSKPEEILNISILLKNNGKEDMNNASIDLIFDAPSLKRKSVLNWPKVNDELDGNIIGTQLENNIRRGTITWTSYHVSDLKNIKPGEEITIDMQLPIHGVENFDMASLDAHQINITSEIKYKNKEGSSKLISSNPIEITLNSDLALEVRSTDKNSSEKNITWILTNNFHSLKDIEIIATLYGDSSFSTPLSSPAGTLNFDDETKKIIWKIVEMPDSIDTLALPFTIKMNQIDPTQNTIISKAHVRAIDAVTNQKIEFMSNEVLIK